MQQQTDNSKLGNIFTWLAWILALALLVFAFQDYLEKQWNPNQEFEHASTNGSAEVILKQNRQGHYVVSGRINGQPVRFLLDTGATEVSIPLSVANQLNLPKGVAFYVQTANGNTKVYRTTINELSIGDIFLYNVTANINPAMHDEDILLGMSALKQLNFQQTGRQLILREK